jgi:Ca-activated chloride channel family protein
MSEHFRYPWVLAVAVVVTAVAVAGSVLLQRRRAAALARTGLSTVGRPSVPARPMRSGRMTGALRRHLPYALFLTAVAVLLVAVARPEATLAVPRASGTVILAFDVSNSMSATDAEPTRLGAAQEAARAFVDAQPSTVDVGVVVFGNGALTTQEPGPDHAEAIAAIGRLKAGGGTSLGQAILAALTAITGRQVRLPAPDDPGPPPDLGYWASATVVLFSDGENTGGPDTEGAAELAAGAGVRIETVGVGTPQGTTIEVDGYQLSTALDEDQLTAIAQATGGAYHRAGDAASIKDTTRSIDLRVTARREPVELTALFAGAALLLLMVGGLLMIRWYGRIV